MKNQLQNKVQGEWIVGSTTDTITIQWNAGNVFASFQDYILLECQPNSDTDNRPITLYKVSITIEAVKDGELDLHGRIIK